MNDEQKPPAEDNHSSQSSSGPKSRPENNEHKEPSKTEPENSSLEGAEQNETETDSEQSTDNKKDEKAKQQREYPVQVLEVIKMHPYFWGSLKALATIKIPGFTIRGIRIVQEEGEDKFKIYPPEETIGRREWTIIKVHNKTKWARIYEEVSKAYLASKEEWDKEGQGEEQDSGLHPRGKGKKNKSSDKLGQGVGTVMNQN